GFCYLKGDGVKRSPSQAKFWFSKAAKQGHRTAERSLRLIPKTAPLPVDPSIDQATREKKGLELYEYLYKLKDYRPARENRNSSTTINGKTTYQKLPEQGTKPDLSKVKAFIRAGADVNWQGEDKRGDKSCALALAVEMEFYELADLLIANGADINLEIGRSDNLKNGSSSILSRNNFGGAISKAVYLLENGADPDYVCNDGRTLLITASRYGSTETVKLLLSYGADPNKLNGKPRFGHYKPANSESALWVVADTTGLLESSTNEVAKLLIEYKADVNYRAPNGTTPLDRAIATQKSAMVKLLKTAGAKTSRELK
ncbi:MAG: ankyrin repeat domain-containing protein, partial [Akkermansia sp.]